MKQTENIDLKQKIIDLEQRLLAIEIEQRKIMEDILSGQPTERMYKRLLEKPNEKISEKNKTIEDYKIEI